MTPVLQKKREKKRRLDSAVADTSKIRFFFLTTMAGEDETSECTPENSKAPADEATAEPALENEAEAEPTTAEPAKAEPTTADPTTAEPARCGPVVQELDLTLDNPTDRALFQLGTLIVNRTENGNYSSRSMPPKRISSDNGNIFLRKKTLPCTFWGNGNRTAMTLLLANDEEALLSKMLVVRLSIGNAKRVVNGVSGNPKNFGLKIKSQERTQSHLDASIAFGRWRWVKALIASKNMHSRQKRPSGESFYFG